MFAYGDISGKYNPLLAPSQQLALTELPMYGEFSMLGLTARRVMDVSTHVAIEKISQLGLDKDSPCNENTYILWSQLHKDVCERTRQIRPPL